MPERLPPQPTHWIDQDQPITFRFEGRSYRGYSGDVLSSALWANGVRVLGRSFKYHRPRGIFSLAGHDVNVMVEGQGRTNLRGDLLPIRSGMDVCAVNTWGGLRRDWLKSIGWFSRFLPVGFYYKAFHTPRRLFPFYERRIRRISGLGQIDPESDAPVSPKDYAFCDLLIAGGGPAGLSAAIAAGEQGLRVLAVDEQPRPGGSLCWQTGGDPQAESLRQNLLKRLQELDNVELRCNTQAGGWYSDHWIALFDEVRMTKLRARATLLATGCFEQPAVFQNNDLPGVLLGSAAQRLIHLYAARPCQRAVVLAANSDAYRVAWDLHTAGVQLAGIAELRPEGDATPIAQQVADAGIPIFKGHTVYEAIPGRGNHRLRAARICPLDERGQPRTAHALRIDCDAVVVSVGWTPNSGLIYQAGGRFRHDDGLQQLVPKTLPDGVFVAGRANGVYELQQQLADGRRAGLQAAQYLGCETPDPGSALGHQGSPPTHAYPIFDHPGKHNFVDLDEDLHLTDFVNAHSEGYDNIELMKRFTTVGMGPSQGKLSNNNAIRILSQLNQHTIEETGTTTSRPFHQPVPLSHLAGRRFHPLRRSPLHQRHIDLGGQMVHAGNWLRPEYYSRPGTTRAACILEEAVNVRNTVGLIDVSPLGKIEVNGQDAARFLEAIYTARFQKQKVGRTRYGLACDETGVIIEDGVIARIANDRFYVTATSSGAAAFYRDLQRWSLILNMHVTLINVTSQLAALNLAGPHARTVLQDLTDVDLDPERFPYLGVRQGFVAGIRATLMRVGFLGELGYEIHLPASATTHVWNVLMQAGNPYGIRPFGIEAQRLLRLEKGHLIVGQDTDALTHPLEANVEWALGKDKPFYIGARSLEILRRQPLTRRLVGLTFESNSEQRLPQECHLIIQDDDIVGRITSVAPNTTLGFPIAMAFVRPDLAAPKTRIHVRLDDGRLVQARVTQLPFYDPDNHRQHAPNSSNKHV
ncbi:MAG: 2Fe-2S iron-sulfur cluster-binding protein [Planctomycetaceae bacterium]